MSLGTKVFKGCDKLKNVVLPDNIIQIPSETFLGCSEMNSIVIPDNVESFDKNSFGGVGVKKILIDKKHKTIEINIFFIKHLLM